MKSLVVVVFISLSVMGQVAWGLPYGAKSPVVALNKNNFADKVFGTEHVWVVEFYAPWCGHCKNLAPEYEKAANNLKGIVPVGAVNCDEEQELCGSFGVKGFPTIKIFPSKLTPVSGKKDTFHKVPEEYQGARSASGIVNYALAKLPSFVVPVTSKTEDKFLEQELPKALLFTNKDKTSDLYKALSIDFHNRLVLGEVKHSDTKLVEKYGVKDFPSLMVLKDSIENAVRLDAKKFTHDALSKFLLPHAAPAPEKAKPSSSSSSKSAHKEPEPTPEPETGEIFEVKDQASFDAHCANKVGLCVVGFLDRENFDQVEWDRYVELLKTLGDKYKGKLRFVYLDGPSQPDLTRALDLSAFYPALVAFNPKKLGYSPFRGAFTEESITEFLNGVLRGSKRSFALDKLPAINTEQPKQPRPPLPHDNLDLDEPLHKFKDEV